MTDHPQNVSDDFTSDLRDYLATFEQLDDLAREIAFDDIVMLVEAYSLAISSGAAMDVPDERAFVEELKSCFGQNMFAGGYSDGAYVPGARIASLIECAYEDILEERFAAIADASKDGGQ